jgi:riboflavin transporter FmnP
MVDRLKAVPLLAVLIATSLVGCGIYDSPPLPPPPPPPPPSSGDLAQLNFEGTQFTTWKSAGAYAFDDANTVEGGSQAITFSQDTAHAKAGLASLQITGTMLKNKYGPDYISDARIYLNSDKTTVDFSAKTITVNFLVRSGTADKVQVTLNDSANQGCQGKYIASTASSGWQTVTFTPSDASQQNYKSPTFDITKVAFVEVRIANEAATTSSQVVWNVDSISWAGGSPPPPPSDLAQLNFEGTQVTTWTSAGAYVYDDANTVEGGSQAITFSQDTAHAKAGLASLQISGTMLKNKNGPDYISDARIYLSSDKTTVVDFSAKTITVSFLVRSGKADNVMVILNDSAYQPCQGKPIASTASSGWQTVTFTPSDASQQNYKSPTFDITKVAFVEVRIADSAATSSSAVVWNVDSISWAAASPPPPAADLAQLNFEGTQVTTWTSAGAYVYDDANTVQGGSQVITFSQDTAHAKAGLASLQISGTMLKNKNGPDYISDARIYLNSDKTAVVDFSAKTITVSFLVQAGTADNVMVILNDSAYQPCQGKPIASTASSGWQTVTFTPSDASQQNYKSPTFDITKVAFVEVRIAASAAPSSPAVVWNVDSISWADGPPPPPPPPPSDLAQLNFEATQVTTWSSAGAYTFDDTYTVQGGSQAITFSQDTAHAKAGLASLQISGTMRQNKNGPDYISDARIYLSSDKTTVVDFSAKTITVSFLVQTGTADQVMVILNDSADQPCQGKPIASTASSGWQTVTFTPSDPSQINWKSPTFDITKVAFVEVRIAASAAPSSPAVVWNVDSISWAPSDLAQLNFEGTQVTTWASASAYTFDDTYTVQGGSQAITFSQDTAHAKAGLASLQISGTMRQNKNGPDYISDARIYLNSDKTTVVDFSAKTITVSFLVQTGTADKVMVILNDSADQPCQGKPIASTASSGWQTVTFTPSDASQINWKSPTFDITKVAFVEVRIAASAAPSSPAVVWNVDSISWADGPPPPPPPPPSDLAQLNFEGTQVTTWSSAGAYTFDDTYTVQGGSQAITFSQDTAHAKAGLASLQISGTMRQNKNGPDYISDARIYLNSDKTTVVDFSAKTITVSFLVQTGTADNVMVILNDFAYQPCQGKPIASTASSGWQTVTFAPSDPSQINWKSPTFDITKVAFVEVRIAASAAPSSSAVVWNVDSISW